MNLVHKTEELSGFENELFLLYSMIAKIAHFRTAILWSKFMF
jgi:hypothetical protein